MKTALSLEPISWKNFLVLEPIRFVVAQMGFTSKLELRIGKLPTKI